MDDHVTVMTVTPRNASSTVIAEVQKKRPCRRRDSNPRHADYDWRLSAHIAGIFGL